MRIAKANLLITIALTGIAAAPLSRAASVPSADIVTFDAPGAGTASGQGTGCFGCTFAINQWGAVVGTYVDGNNIAHGFIRSPDGKSFTKIDAPDAFSGLPFVLPFVLGTFAQSINDWGEITGYFLDQSFNWHGFVRTPEGVFTAFDGLGGGPPVPLYINLEGAVVGYAQDTGSLSHAFLRRPDGTFVAFTGPSGCTGGNAATPPCYGNEATYVNLLGSSVGNFTDNTLVSHGLIRSPGGVLTKFDAPGAGNGPPASITVGGQTYYGPYQGTGCPGCNLGVNFFGEIAGTYIDKYYVSHGYIRSPDGRFTTVDVPGAGIGVAQGTGCSSDCPVGLNDLGEITGSYHDSVSAQHGFLRMPDGHFETIDPPGSIGTQPESINDSGAIVGYYIDAQQVAHGFLVLRGH